MRLDIAHRRRRNSGDRQRTANEILLRHLIRRREAAAPAVLVDRRSANDGEDAIAVGLRIGEPLEHDDAAAFAAAISVRTGIERLATPVGGQHPRPAERDEDLGQQGEAHRPPKRSALPGRRLWRQMDRDERRRQAVSMAMLGPTNPST